MNERRRQAGRAGTQVGRPPLRREGFFLMVRTRR